MRKLFCIEWVHNAYEYSLAKLIAEVDLPDILFVYTRKLEIKLYSTVTTILYSNPLTVKLSKVSIANKRNSDGVK